MLRIVLFFFVQDGKGNLREEEIRGGGSEAKLIILLLNTNNWERLKRQIDTKTYRVASLLEKIITY